MLKKEWRVYDLDKHEFFISRDVVFRETEFPFASPPDTRSPTLSSPLTTVDYDWDITHDLTFVDRGAWF